MLTKNIKFKNFIIKGIDKKRKKDIHKKFVNLLNENNEILRSLSKIYKNSYKKKLLTKLKKKIQILIIGMGGSILGSRAIYNFLKPKTKKFYFIDNFKSFNLKKFLKKDRLNLIISKSGNTLETISNSNILINKNYSNVFITENKQSYLMDLAKKLKAEVVYHNDFIGGRYSVLSEVGMLPAELMGFSPKKFRRLNYLVKNKQFINNLILNVSNTLNLIKRKKFNSIILNYDARSNDLFKWYQQLIAESLGKKNTGILPIISSMPEDNHSLMQFYLDGKKNNFFTFFFTKERNSKKINNDNILKSHEYLKNKSLLDISYSQFLATEKVFKKKNIPYRSFVINNRNEETMGELFAFFILETILLGRSLKVNPFDQPSVELIKNETKKILTNS